METLLLTRDDVAEIALMDEMIRAVEEAFAAYEPGDAQMSAKSYVDLPQYNGDFRSKSAYVDASMGEGRRSSGSTSIRTTPIGSGYPP